MSTANELIQRAKTYNKSVDEDVIQRAYDFCKKAHEHQKRASGEPYYLHPVAVAGILTDMKLDTASIATALMHDTIEDTAATYDELKKEFGEEIANLVDGVTKLSQIEMQSDQAKQAENFRKLVLAMSEDIRVLLVKLADRLHNMRTLDHLREEKRQRIARETMEIYAPLAERLGISEWKDELEDLSFTQVNPDARDSIMARLAYLRKEGGNIVDRIVKELNKTLYTEGIKATIYGREKSPYSIWVKMHKRNVPFEEMADIIAFRIIVDDIGDCYHALGVIHEHYPVVPGRFKDYISTPKPNGYRSLHTAVIGPEKKRIEIQIRTKEMHEIAEHGVAAHWEYKDKTKGRNSDGGQQEGKRYRWLRELLDILEHAQKPEEFLEHTKLELFQDQVFCFTPKGDLISLPRGATPVDFAYAVHSQVGDTCVGAKVNGRMVPLRTALENGDQVEVATSSAQTPSPTWERFVVTGKARARIRRYIRQQQRSQYMDLGKAMMVKQFRQEGYEFSEKSLESICHKFNVKEIEDLYVSVGSGMNTTREVFNAAFPSHGKKLTGPEEADQKVVSITESRSKVKGKDKPLAIRGLIPGMAVHYARCCHPLPGDRIVGIVTTGKGVSIHTIDCETLESFAEMPERWIDVAWEDESQTPEHMVGRLYVVVGNEPGSLGTLSTVIGKNGGNITNLKITSRSQDFFEMLIDVDVKDLRHLTNIIAALRATPVVNSVERARGR